MIDKYNKILAHYNKCLKSYAQKAESKMLLVCFLVNILARVEYFS